MMGEGTDKPARTGWLPRDSRAATRLGLHLLVAGVGLHVGLLVALGPARSGHLVQGASLAGQVLTSLAVGRWGDRLPARTWAVLVVVVTPLIGTLPPFYPEATLLAVPLLFLLVVFASRSLGSGVARVVTVESVLVTTWIASQLEGGNALALVQVFFVAGVLVLVHRALVHGADAQERLVGTLERRASTDGLTGLLTRSAFEAGVDDALAGAGTPVSLLLVDIDHFKAVNDQHGHPVGDAALQHVAGVIEARVRRAGGLVGRLGGDELGVLLVDCAEGPALARAQELVAAVRISAVRSGSGILVPLTISVGVGSARPGDRRAELYAATDVALYDAKRGGRDRAAVTATDDRGTTPGSRTRNSN